MNVRNGVGKWRFWANFATSAKALQGVRLGGTCQNIMYSQVKGGASPPPPTLPAVLHGALLVRCASGRGVEPVRQGLRLDALLRLKPAGLRPQKGCGYRSDRRGGFEGLERAFLCAEWANGGRG